jgi:hypothetical protein
MAPTRPEDRATLKSDPSAEAGGRADSVAGPGLPSGPDLFCRFRRRDRLGVAALVLSIPRSSDGHQRDKLRGSGGGAPRFYERRVVLPIRLGSRQG